MQQVHKGHLCVLVQYVFVWAQLLGPPAVYLFTLVSKLTTFWLTQTTLQYYTCYRIPPA